MRNNCRFWGRQLAADVNAHEVCDAGTDIFCWKNCVCPCHNFSQRGRSSGEEEANGERQ